MFVLHPMAQKTKRTRLFFVKAIALFLSVSFLLMDIQPFPGASARPAYAEPPAGSPAPRHGITDVNPSQIADSQWLPAELGTIQEHFIPSGASAKTPFVIDRKSVV